MEMINIRPAMRADSKAILKLIDELAEFEKLAPPDSKGKRKLIKDAFSNEHLFYVLLAEYDNMIIGYAFYFFTYSSFLAKRTLYLEDIFISSEHRNKGIGKLFFKDLIKIAKKNKCGRMEWVVLDWNKNAIEFYSKLGAEELKEWKTFRMKI